VHIVELSTAFVTVDTKVINAGLTQIQCLQITMCTAGLNARWDTATARRHWTEQWQRDQVRRRPQYQTEPYLFFFGRDLINDDSSFCSHILLAID